MTATLEMTLTISRRAEREMISGISMMGFRVMSRRLHLRTPLINFLYLSLLPVL